MDIEQIYIEQILNIYRTDIKQILNRYHILNRYGTDIEQDIEQIVNMY